MGDRIYQTIVTDLRARIEAQEFSDLKLPDERSLAEHYHVSRSSIKRAMTVLADSGAIFKKQGSGTFINPLFLKKKSLFNYSGPNVGITDSFQKDGQRPSIRVLSFEVVKAPAEVSEALFIQPEAFVYRFHRLRSFDAQPFMIEIGYLPIALIPNLTSKIVEKSLFNYLQDVRKQRVSKTYLTLSAEPSTPEDQRWLGLRPTEPVGVMAGTFFLDDGTPCEFSSMRLHYRYMAFNTFVTV